MAIVLGLLGVTCLGYGVSVMLLMSGTLFFAVWYALGLMLLLAAWATRNRMWQKVPTVVCRVGRVVLATVLVVLLTTQVLIGSQMHASGEADLDYVVVLGAQIYDDGSPSPVLRYRLDAAATYLSENPRTRCIVSGGKGPNEPYPEARGMAAYLLRQGVEGDRITQESRSTNTRENVMFAQSLMDGAAPRVGIVTNDFHVYRALCVARKAGLANCCGIAAYSTPSFLPNNLLRESLGIVKDFVAGNI